LKNKRKRHAAEIAFAWRNERRTKRNLRRGDIRQARRPAGADDGLAQQPGHGAARHAARRATAFNTMFPAKLSEIAILVTARHWTSHYEWFAHKRLALKGGMDPKIIEDIRDRRTPTSTIPRAR
jgi:alkylhydroperoxidase family enzyme